MSHVVTCHQLQWPNSTGNCKLGHDCRPVCLQRRLRCWQICSDSSRLSPTSCEYRTHRRRDSTRQLIRVGVGGVYWASDSKCLNAVAATCRPMTDHASVISKLFIASWASIITKHTSIDILQNWRRLIRINIFNKTNSKAATTSKIKHAIKHKTSPARLAQLLHNCCSPLAKTKC